MCVRRDFQNIVHQDMEFSLLEKTVDEVINWPQKRILFNLTGVSEPTLYPKLVDAVAYINERIPLAKIKMITNGILLTPSLSMSLLKAGLGEIMVSLNGTSQTDYLSICGVDQYETVTANINALIENRHSLKANKLRININIKRHDANRSDIQKMLSHWKPLLGSEDVVSVADILPLRQGNPIQSCWNIPRRYPCAHLWGEVKLDVKGNIYPCDGKVMDFNYRERSELLLGNLHQTSLADTYLSEKVKNFRKVHLSGQFDQLATCKACPVWSIFPNYWIYNKLFPFSRRKWL